MRLRSTRLTALSRGTRNPVWTPAQLGSSLALWLDADDASTIILNGSTVSEWRDKSGNGRHATQGTATNQPTYAAASLNGKPSLVFDADFLNYDGAFLANTNYTVAALHYRSSNKNGNFFLGGAGQATNQNFLMGYEVPSTKFRWGQFVNDVDTLGLTDVLGVPVIAMARHSNADGKNTYINGVSGGVSANKSPLSSSNGATIGQLLGNYFVGGIAEIVITTSALTAEDRQRLEGYLAWKWGLTANLPASHPYKNFPPFV